LLLRCAGRRSVAAVEQTARERESPLRFALGELRFAGVARPDVERQIADVEERLRAIAAATQHELAQLTDQEIALVAHRASLGEKLDELRLQMSRLVDEEAPRHGRNPELAARLSRLRAAADLVERAPA